MSTKAIFTRFTKGPWKIDKPSEDGFYITTEKQQLIAEVWGLKYGAPYDAGNAHLIAAAPKMYEALEQIKGYLNDLSEGLAVNTVENIIDGVLSKARGES